MDTKYERFLLKTLIHSVCVCVFRVSMQINVDKSVDVYQGSTVSDNMSIALFRTSYGPPTGKLLNPKIQDHVNASMTIRGQHVTSSDVCSVSSWEQSFRRKFWLAKVKGWNCVTSSNRAGSSAVNAAGRLVITVWQQHSVWHCCFQMSLRLWNMFFLKIAFHGFNGLYC